MTVKVEVFYSPYCPNCPEAMKLVRDVCAKFRDIEIEEVNCLEDDGKQRAIKYRISFVPTIVINGETKLIGIPNEDDFSKTIENELKIRK
jgi:thioredoxin 1